MKIVVVRYSRIDEWQNKNIPFTIICALILRSLWKRLVFIYKKDLAKRLKVIMHRQNCELANNVFQLRCTNVLKIALFKIKISLVKSQKYYHNYSKILTICNFNTNIGKKFIMWQKFYRSLRSCGLKGQIPSNLNGFLLLKFL